MAATTKPIARTIPPVARFAAIPAATVSAADAVAAAPVAIHPAIIFAKFMADSTAPLASVTR